MKKKSQRGSIFGDKILKPIDSIARKVIKGSDEKPVSKGKIANQKRLAKIRMLKNRQFNLPTKGVKCLQCNRVVLNESRVLIEHLRREHGIISTEQVVQIHFGDL